MATRKRSKSKKPQANNNRDKHSRTEIPSGIIPTDFDGGSPKLKEPYINNSQFNFKGAL